MKALQPASQRERILLAVFLLIVLVASYTMLRLKPMQVHKVVLEEQFERSRSTLSNAKPLRPSARDTAALREKISALQEQVAQAQSTLAGFENSFIDLARSDAVASMRKQITQLAVQQDVKVLKINASTMDLTQLVDIDVQGTESDAYSLLKRRLFDIQLRGDFYRLNRFISSLRQLPHAVVVTRLAFSTDQNQAPQTLLQAALTLAF